MLTAATIRSMIDCDIFEALAKQLGIADHTRRGTTHGADEYGTVHLVLFGDFKQLRACKAKG